MRHWICDLSEFKPWLEKLLTAIIRTLARHGCPRMHRQVSRNIDNTRTIARVYLAGQELDRAKLLQPLH